MIDFLSEAPDLPKTPMAEVIEKGLLTPGDLFKYQNTAIDFAWMNTDCMLWLQMGLGKTVITETVIARRIQAGHVSKVLVFGPLRVVESVWDHEAKGWSHLRHLRFSKIVGSIEKRRRALFADADIYLCNYENMNWLAGELEHYFTSQGKPLPFQMVVYDEVTKMKQSTGVRMAGTKRDKDVVNKFTGEKTTETQRVVGWKSFVNLFSYRMGLTGSPAPNGYIDLHGQFLCVDGGSRLGEFVTSFRDNFFTKDYSGFKYQPTSFGRDQIERLIADITLNMNAKDHIKGYPEPRVIDEYVDLPAKARKTYEKLEEKLVADLESGTTLEVANPAVLSNKCQQLCNGSVYLSDPLRDIFSDPDLEDKVRDAGGIEDYVTKLEAEWRALPQKWEAVHDVKLKALEDIIAEANGAPVLCAYTFKPDAERIVKKFGKKMKVVNLTATPSSQTRKVITDWQNGEIDLLLGHPASMGHGVDGLQKAGWLGVWFGPTWSLELWDQFNSRLARTGQKLQVIIKRILVRDSVDELIVAAVDAKMTDENDLKKAVVKWSRTRDAGGSVAAPVKAAPPPPPPPPPVFL